MSGTLVSELRQSVSLATFVEASTFCSINGQKGVVNAWLRHMPWLGLIRNLWKRKCDLSLICRRFIYYVIAEFGIIMRR